MELQAVLMSRSQPARQMLAGVLEDFDISLETCGSAQEGIELMARGKYAAMVLDFDVP